MNDEMLVKTPSSVSVKFFATNVAEKVGVVFDVLVPDVNTVIGLVSPHTALVFESSITFTTLEWHHV